MTNLSNLIDIEIKDSDDGELGNAIPNWAIAVIGGVASISMGIGTFLIGRARLKKNQTIAETSVKDNLVETLDSARREYLQQQQQEQQANEEKDKKEEEGIIFAENYEHTY